MCSYNPLCTLIPHKHCQTFDKRTHNLYLSATSHTRTQPAHATFLDRTHHGLHIPSMLNQQLKSCARELDVRLNSKEPLQSAFPRARLAALHQNHTTHPILCTQPVATSVPMVYTFAMQTNPSSPTRFKHYSTTPTILYSSDNHDHPPRTQTTRHSTSTAIVPPIYPLHIDNPFTTPSLTSSHHKPHTLLLFL